MITNQRFLLDADVFITAKNRYYSFDICPGFWTSMIHRHRRGCVFSIDRVRTELLDGDREDDVVCWVRDEVPDGFFLRSDAPRVVWALTDLMKWAQRHPRYESQAKEKFARGADAWLVAYGRVHGVTVVTNEQSAPESKKSIKLPDVCDEFDVRHVDLFSMLRALNVHFDWTGDG